MQHRISAGVIVADGQRLLLVRHLRPGRYDFWVCPGGGVQGDESLQDAARREAHEETGLDIEVGPLAYIEELLQPGMRHCKFWFVGQVVGGELDAGHPEAAAEHITEAAWCSLDQLTGATVFPRVVRDRFWRDRERGFAAPIHLPLEAMQCC